MGFLRSAARAYMLHRLTQGGRRGHRRSAQYRRGPGRYGYGRPRPRSGFDFLGPFPSYSRRTRGGSRVRVTGCCLPIPLAMTIGAAGAVHHAVTRR